jgi:hypothetical protein
VQDVAQLKINFTYQCDVDPFGVYSITLYSTLKMIRMLHPAFTDIPEVPSSVYHSIHFQVLIAVHLQLVVKS